MPSHAGTLSSLTLYPTTVSAKVKVKPRIRQARSIFGFRQDCLGQRPTDCWQHVRASPFCSCSVSQNITPKVPAHSRSEPQEEVPLTSSWGNSKQSVGKNSESDENDYASPFPLQPSVRRAGRHSSRRLKEHRMC